LLRLTGGNASAPAQSMEYWTLISCKRSGLTVLLKGRLLAAIIIRRTLFRQRCEQRFVKSLGVLDLGRICPASPQVETGDPTRLPLSCAKISAQNTDCCRRGPSARPCARPKTDFRAVRRTLHQPHSARHITSRRLQ